MNNKKKIVLFAFLLGTTIIVGQHKPDREKIKTLKVAFITDELDLSSSEAEKFWPIYNAHEARVKKINHTKGKDIRTKFKNIEAISNQESEALLKLQEIG